MLFPSNHNLLPIDGVLEYYPKFLKHEEADFYYDDLLNQTEWKSYEISIFGKKLLQPRLSAWYGEKGYSYSGISLQAKPYTPLLAELQSKLESLGSNRFNSVLLNLYRNERDSMGWHADDEKELGLNPCIASLSLGCERVFQYKHKTRNGKTNQLILQSGSLLLMKEEMQHHWLHAIPKSIKTKGPRINLTFRLIR